MNNLEPAVFDKIPQMASRIPLMEFSKKKFAPETITMHANSSRNQYYLWDIPQKKILKAE